MKFKSFFLILLILLILLIFLLSTPTIVTADYCSKSKVPSQPFPLRYSVEIVSTQPDPPRPAITHKVIVVEFFTSKFADSWSDSIGKTIYHQNVPSCIHEGCVQRQDDLVVNVPHNKDKLYALPGTVEGKNGHWLLLDRWANVYQWSKGRILTAYCHQPELWEVIKAHFPFAILKLP